MSGRRGCLRKTGKKGKRVEKRGGGANAESEVVIFIGLVEWNGSNECLTPKHMPLKVDKNDPSAVLLQKALEKLKAYFSNSYNENEDYILLLEDYKEAMFLHGSTKEFFTIQCFKTHSTRDCQPFLKTLVNGRDEGTL